MKGSVVKTEAKTWKYTVDVGIDHLTGKRKRTSKGGFKTKRECEAAMNELLVSVENNTYSKESKMNVKEYMDYWLENYVSINVSASTKKRYGFSINDINFYLGKVQLSQLKPIHIQRLYGQLLQDKGQSKSTVLKTHRALHKALKCAVGWQLISNNPCEFVTAPRPEKVEMKVWTDKESKEFLKKIEDECIYIEVAIALHTGMRQGEICAVKWSSIDFKTNTLSVRNTMHKVNGKFVLGEPKTKKSIRTISLGKTIVAILKKWQTKQKENKLLYGEDYFKSDFVCTWPDGKLIDPHFVCKKFPKLVKDYGFERIRFHDLRHTHATILLTKKISTKVVSERLGHSTTAITLDTYSHVLPNMQQEAAKKVDEALG